MLLTKEQLNLMREAGISVSDISAYDYPAEDEEALADLLMNSLGPGQSWTAKAQAVEDLLCYLVEEIS